MNEQMAIDLAERWLHQHHQIDGAIHASAAASENSSWYVELRCESLKELVAVLVDAHGYVVPLGEGLPYLLHHDTTGETGEIEARF